jgi:hypothetical protein
LSGSSASHSGGMPFDRHDTTSSSRCRGVLQEGAAWWVLRHRTTFPERMRLVSTSRAEGVTESRCRNSMKFQKGRRLQHFLTCAGDQAKLIYELFQVTRKLRLLHRRAGGAKRDPDVDFQQFASPDSSRTREISPLRASSDLCVASRQSVELRCAQVSQSCAVIGAMLRGAGGGTRSSSCPAPIFREKISKPEGKSVKDAEPGVQS